MTLGHAKFYDTLQYPGGSAGDPLLFNSATRQTFGEMKDKPQSISLERFADAKVKKYDKRKVIEKQQEEKLRLKSKFKKLQRKLVSEGKLDANGSLLDVKDNVEELERELVGVSQRHEDKQQVQERATTSSRAPAAERAKPVGKSQKHTGPSQIQRLAAKVEEEKEKARLAREEVLRQRAEKQATFEASLRERQRARQNHLRKTSRGQPLMKYRMQEILEVLEGKKKQKR